MLHMGEITGAEWLDKSYSYTGVYTARFLIRLSRLFPFKGANNTFANYIKISSSALWAMREAESVLVKLQTAKDESYGSIRLRGFQSVTRTIW